MHLYNNVCILHKILAKVIDYDTCYVILVLIAILILKKIYIPIVTDNILVYFNSLDIYNNIYLFIFIINLKILYFLYIDLI